MHIRARPDHRQAPPVPQSAAPGRGPVAGRLGSMWRLYFYSRAGALVGAALLSLSLAACDGDEPESGADAMPTRPADAGVDAGAWLDPTFGEGGYLALDRLEESRIDAVARGPDDAIYFGGQTG